MQHDAFIGQIQTRARLDSRGAAEAATRATLETLAERITPELAENLASQLPRELGENVLRVTSNRKSGPAGAESFGEREFIDRVAEREHSDHTTAAHNSRAVFEMLDEATTGEIMNKVRQTLPEDLREFTLQGSQG